MRNRYCYTIARKYNKVHKKEINIFVSGIALVFVVFSLMLFLILSFYLYIIPNFNIQQYSKTLSIRYGAQIQNDLDDFFDINKNKINEESHYFVYATNLKYSKFVIDDKEYDTNLNQNFDYLCFIDENDKRIFNSDDERYAKDMNLGNVILSGSKNIPEKDEVFISSTICDALNINYDDIIDNNISLISKLNNKNSTFVDNCVPETHLKGESSLVNKEYYVFKNFKVSGVFNGKLDLGCAESTGLFFSASSTINECLYTNENFDGVFEDKVVNLPINFNYFAREKFTRIHTESIMMNAKLYNEIIKLSKPLANQYGCAILTSLFIPSFYTTFFFKIYSILNIVSIIGFILSAIIFVAFMISLFNSTLYYIEQSKSYIGMLKAIGMENKDIIKIKIFEILDIFMKTILIVVPLSTILLIYFTKMYDNYIIEMMSSYATEEMVSLVLMPYWYYPLSFLITLIFTLGFGILITFFISRNFLKTNTLSLLNSRLR